MTVSYEIKVEGQLDSSWAGWFDGMSMRQTENGQTILTGPLPDQAALHGVLARVRDLGLPLIAVNRIETDNKEQSHNGGQ